MADWNRLADLLEERPEVNIHKHHEVFPVSRPALAALLKNLVSEFDPNAQPWCEQILKNIEKSGESAKPGKKLNAKSKHGPLRIGGRKFEAQIHAKQSGASESFSYDAIDEAYLRFETPLHGHHIYLWVSLRRNSSSDRKQAALQLALGMYAPNRSRDRYKTLPKELQQEIRESDPDIGWGVGAPFQEDWIREFGDPRVVWATQLTALHVRELGDALIEQLGGCGNRGLESAVFKLAELADRESGKPTPPKPNPGTKATQEPSQSPEAVRATRLLQRHKQAILTGPPGTGKTWVANQVARHYRQRGGKVGFVTFHPSMSYEDFIEGLRPDVDGKQKGGLRYTVKPGHFLSAMTSAFNAPDEDHLLIIDEINRGNLSRIFGELITSLEVDKRARIDCKDEGAKTLFADGMDEATQKRWFVPPGVEPVKLAYSSDTVILVPQNLHVLGTMNTADRSIALMDFALRRRFRFCYLAPQMPVALKVASDRGLKLDGLDEAVRVFEKLNRRIEVLKDRDHQIGHSYLIDVVRSCEQGIGLEQALDECLVDQVVPLLLEYFYEDWARVRLLLGKDLVPKVPVKEQDMATELSMDEEAKRQVQLKGPVYRQLRKHLLG